MIPVTDYASLLEFVEFKYANTGERNKRMIGIVFASPQSPLAKAEIVPRVADWHFRAGKLTDFFFAGYEEFFAEQEGYVKVDVPGLKHWWYSAEHFSKFRRELENLTTWEYSGGNDLLLTNTFWDSNENRAKIDFGSTIVCALDRMKADKTIDSVEQFFETVIRSSEHGMDSFQFSDQQGLRVGRSALKRMVLGLLPQSTGEDVNKLMHYAIKDVGK